GKCLLGVSIIIDKQNSQYLENMVKLFKDIGVKSIKLSPCITHNESKLTNEYHNEFFNQTKQLCKNITTKYSDDNCQIFDSYHLQLETFDKDYKWCPYIQICPVIGADQNVYACHDKAYNLDNGLLFSIKNQGFKDGWFKDKKQFFKIKPCEDCNHHCVVDEKNKILLEYLNIDKKHLEFV
ncbi:radical SAM protein, partial [Campylobacter fetus subsp. testudinum]